MQTAINKIANTLWLTLIALIIVSGLLVGIGRLASPYLITFKADIEAEASRILGSNIQIGDISAHWHGFGPSLQLKNVSISNNNQHSQPLKLKRIDLDLSVRPMLETGTFLPWNVVLHGIDLQLIRDSYGQLHVLGISDTGSQSNETFSIEPLLEMPRIELINTQVSWTDLTKKTPSTEFKQINLLARNDGDRHQLNLSFELPGSPVSQIKLAADINLSARNLNNWSGDVHLETTDISRVEWINAVLPEPLVLNKATSNSSLWLTAVKGNLTQASGKTHWRDVSLSSTENNSTLELEHFSTNFSWKTTGNEKEKGWTLALADLNLQTADWHSDKNSLLYALSNNTHSLTIDHLQTDIWQTIQPFLPANDVLSSNKFQTSGLVNDLKVFWQADSKAWFTEGHVQNFTFIPETRPDKKIQTPGIKNLTASFEASSDYGRLTIQSENAEYIHPGMFRSAIQLNGLSGNLQWHQTTDKHWIIQTDRIDAITPDLDTATRLFIDLDPDGKTLVDIQTDFKDGVGSNASIYYPVGVLGDELVKWLDRSIISGKVTSGSFILKGPVDDFAFAKTHNGRFEVLFNVEDIVLDYFPEWPRLEEADAQVRFINNSLNIKLASGKIFDTDIFDATADIQSLDPLSPIVIKGTTLGPASDNLKILAESPLKDDFDSLAKSMSVTGDSKVFLNFQVPLGSYGEHRLNGVVNFQQNNLKLTEWDLDLQKVNGKLLFNLDGLGSQNLTAQILGAPATVKFSSDQQRNTVIDAKMNLHTLQLKNFFTALPADMISGTSQWQVGLTIPPISKSKNQSAQLRLSSDLEGIDIFIPQPLGKTYTQKRPLEIKALLNPDGTIPVEFSYETTPQQQDTRATSAFGQLLLDISNRKAPEMKSAHLYLGSSKPGKNNQRSLSLTGSVETINISEWLDWSANLPSGGSPVLPISVDLSSDQISYKDVVFKQFNIKADKHKNSLKGTISSNEAKGHFEIPNLKKLDKVSLALDEAAIEINIEDMETAGESDTTDAFNPASAPDLDIRIEKFIVNKENFGKVLFRSTRGKDSMRLDEFRLDGDKARVDAHGIWLVKSDGQKSMLDFELDSKNFGETLQSLGYTPQIANGNAHFEGSLWWRGGPPEFNQDTLSGKLQMEIREGRFVEVDPGAGRILGILNLAALGRRLTLDFSDLFKEGFTFDEINSTFNLDQGDAYTNNLLLKSPAATINLSGRVGLKNKDFDQLVTVTPSLQSTITIAGAVAGGPAGAAVAFLAQKLIGKEVDKLARTRYTVTGPWEEPVITKLKPINNEENEEENNTDSIDSFLQDT